ncbi:MAG: prolyl aminopeptidase [Stackebrandtia sp.]
MMRLYPDIEPDEQGMLAVGDGNHIHWETCGNPRGKPAVVLHGGPGSGCTPGWRRFFNPDLYRIVLFDQRGSGRSTPRAADPAVDLAANTTHHLLADIERLRHHLRIERWLVFGGSWGSTLGLAYAQAHPEHVSQIVLFSITTTTRREVEWVTRDMGRIFPAEWARFRDGVPEADRNGDLADAYSRLLRHPDPTVRDRAARDWCTWEDTHVATTPDHRPSPRHQDPAFRMGFARLVTHYWRHTAWLQDGILLRDAPRLAGISGRLIHGKLDISGPPDIAWHLAQAWPDATLTLIDQAGHGAHHSGVTAAVIAATDEFAAHR